MRPIRSGEEVGGRNLVDIQSLADIHEVWNIWEIHCMILLSLFLQIFLFFTAGLRRCSTSFFLRTVLWLAYLSADAVAIFVLGHLAVRASEPGHQLMSFWAPFVLVHMGGQDTITAFSKQDNELWMRHVLSWFTQVGLAGYVVDKASWPDRLLTSAMVVMFLSGCIKYAERTWCLFVANPVRFTSFVMAYSLPNTLGGLKTRERLNATSKGQVKHRFDLMSEARREDSQGDEMIMDVALFVDAPPNTQQIISAADSVSGWVMEFQSSAVSLYGAYDFVGEHMVNQYKVLYTKHWVRRYFYGIYTKETPEVFKVEGVFVGVLKILRYSYILLYPLFLFISAPVALVLFSVAEKGDQQLHTSRADITVSYILLVGAIALDVCSVAMLFLSIYIPSASSSIHRQQWSEELGQYSMIRRHVVQDTIGLRSSIRQWIGKRLGEWGVDLLELTQTPLTRPIKELILDKLLVHSTKEEWHVASSRGLLAVQSWKERGQHQEGSIPSDPSTDYGALQINISQQSLSITKEEEEEEIEEKEEETKRPLTPLSRSTTELAQLLEGTIRSTADFPTSVLIWHLATNMCYYNTEDTANTNNNHYDQVKKEKDVSRKISNYIMYLVFKRGVMLTYNSKYLHEKAHSEITEHMRRDEDKGYPISGDEKAGLLKISEASIYDRMEADEVHQHGANDKAGLFHLQKLSQSAKSFESLVLPRARALAQMLISIKEEGEAGRWGLIAAVWSEMLYYVAPRCGGAFHYEHLSTGGEFVTHVLALMRELGPFMPPPDVVQ